MSRTVGLEWTHGNACFGSFTAGRSCLCTCHTEALVSCELGSLSLATSYGSLESFLKYTVHFHFSVRICIFINTTHYIML